MQYLCGVNVVNFAHDGRRFPPPIVMIPGIQNFKILYFDAGVDLQKVLPRRVSDGTEPSLDTDYGPVGVKVNCKK